MTRHGTRRNSRSQCPPPALPGLSRLAEGRPWSTCGGYYVGCRAAYDLRDHVNGLTTFVMVGGRQVEGRPAVCETGEDDAALYRLSYVSDIIPFPADELDSRLRQILIQSHIRNSRDGITGFLITYRGWYAQVIEGPLAAVNSCYARIAGDHRHANPEIKSRGLVGLRLFPQWSMCGLTLSARDADILRLAEQGFGLDLRAASTPMLIQFMDTVSRRYNDQVEGLYRALKKV